ncbi:DUF481 domain-containing protein [Aliidiomarina sp. Khilg15.8]
MQKRVLSLIAVAALSSPVMAQDAEGEAAMERTWSAEAELGLLLRTGNTESQSWKAKFNVERDTELWRHAGELDYYRQERDTFAGDTVVDADRLFSAVQSNRKFDEDSRSSLFGYLSYEDDELSSYEYQATVAAGYGNRYVHSEDIYMDFEAGPGYSYDKRRASGETDGEWILRLAGMLNWNISENSRFTQNLSTEIGDDNRRTRSVSALTTNINSSLAIRVSLTLTHNSTVFEQANGRVPEKLDTETAVTLVYTL